MDRKPKISITVPIYNMSLYLEKCLESIMAQTFKDWECLLIDDGSTDSSPGICDAFTRKDGRFKVIHQPNGGVSKARNTGLENSIGEYIAFIDPDDWVEPKYLEHLFTIIRKYDADVAQCGFVREFTNFTRKKPLTDKEKVVSRDEAIPMLLNNSQLPSLLWTKLYRKEIVTEKFPEGKTYEDAYTMPSWFRNVNKVAFTPELLYHYRIRGGSITKIGMARNHYNFVEACTRLGNMVHDSVPKKFDEVSRNRYLVSVHVSGAKTIARKEKDSNLREEVIKKISDRLLEIPNPGIKHLGLKLWFRAYLLKNHRHAFEKLMRVVNKLDLHAKRRRKSMYE